MSYILEALKKAQAERQLGSSPTLHAPTLQSAAQAASGGRLKAPMVLALLGMAAVIGVLLTLVLRTADPVAPAPLVAAPEPQARLPQQPVAVAPAPAPQPALASQPTPLPAPVADLPPSVAKLAKASAPEAQTQTAAPASAAVPATVAPKPAAAPEEPVMNLRDLPEPIQRSVPQVSVGGYIYSKNPADRLLLVDKVLRHEGEEVAPGLTLEKLQPKEAVFNYKGYRYRVPY
jgi:general secretion pathway protein B